MRIERVTETTLCEASEVHALAWAESHRSFCSAEFVALHTPKRQNDYLRQEMLQGKALFLLRDDIAVGVVSVRESLIENLYVRPDRQGRGCGSALLRFAIRQCNNAPTLWALSNNLRARALYECFGVRPTGEMIPLKNGFVRIGNAAILAVITQHFPSKFQTRRSPLFPKTPARCFYFL